MIVKILSAALWGLEGFAVTVEAAFTRGLPETNIIGLPDAAVKESLSRISAAAGSLSLPLPRGGVTVNLAPADRKKQGSGFDLPILMALLSGTCLKDRIPEGCAFFGELGLDGSLRGGSGALCRAMALRDAGAKTIFVPKENEKECSVISEICVYGVENVSQILRHLTGEEPLSPTEFSLEESLKRGRPAVDLAHIKGQEVAKRALEIAAAGNLNLLLVGPPGSGKSLLSKALAGILPQMSFEEMLQTTAIHSAGGTLPPDTALITQRPIRSPHHTMSFAGLSGGGATPQPGELSLSHNGVLFLDELPEFEKRSLEILRQPLEDRCITITRAAWKMTFPADFMLVCAMNPCPCGYWGDPTHPCTCTKNAVEKYLGKISGPLLDRIDLRVEVPALSFDELHTKEEAESSRTVRQRVEKAREIAIRRGKEYGIRSNGQMTGTLTAKLCQMDESAEESLRESFQALNLSARGHDRILRIARTVADLEGAEIISERHILEAVQYRTSSEKYFS